MRWASCLLPLLLFACRGESEAPSNIDLLALTPTAEKHWGGVLLEFGSPAARPFLFEGWSHGETDEEGNAFRWAIGERSTFRFESKDSGAHVAWLECVPFRFDGAPAQVLSISLNGRLLPPLRIGEGRGRRYPLEVDLDPGLNEVEIRYAYSRAPGDLDAGSADRRRLAAAFYRFEVLPRNRTPLAEEPGAFSSIRALDGSSGIYLPEDGRLSYFLEIPSRAELAVTVGAEKPAQLLVPTGASLEIEVRPEKGPPVTAVAEATAPRGEVLTVKLRLSALAGRRAELRFRARRAGMFVAPFLSFLRRSTGVGQGMESQAGEDVNVLMIVLDGATALRMGVYGFPGPTTPEIDRLAEGSVVFDQAITQAVYTIASIGSLVTGQYPDRHRSVSFADRLPSSAVTFPEILRRSGILTVAVSGNAVVSSAFGLDRGFEEFFAVRELEGYTGRGDSVLRTFSDWLTRERGRRFFAYVHFREPHFPYDPPPPFDHRFGPSQPFPHGIVDWTVIEGLNQAAGRGEEVASNVIQRVRGLYDGNMAYVDGLVGQMLADLEKSGLAHETAVILLADHGEALFEHGYIGHNTQLYEESIRVPLIVKLPGKAPRRVSDVVELIDLAPTVLELMGLGDHPARSQMQGRSLVSLLNGGSVEERPAFSRTLWDKPRYSARDGRHKLIWDSRNGGTELYDLAEDPREAVNLAGEPAVAVGFLRQRLFRWVREQELLRAGSPAPEAVVIEEDLMRQLDELGYVQYLEKKTKR